MSITTWSKGLALPLSMPQRWLKTGRPPRHTNPTTTETTIYSPRSGASPIPSPASYSGGRDIRSARAATVDSQLWRNWGRLREKEKFCFACKKELEGE
jgi:hypothetical protein